MKFLMQRCHGGQVLNVFPAGGRVSSLGDMALWVVAAGRVQVQFMGMVVNRGSRSPSADSAYSSCWNSHEPCLCSLTCLHFGGWGWVVIPPCPGGKKPPMVVVAVQSPVDVCISQRGRVVSVSILYAIDRVNSLRIGLYDQRVCWKYSGGSRSINLFINGVPHSHSRFGLTLFSSGWPIIYASQSV